MFKLGKVTQCWHVWCDIIGVENNTTSHREKLVSALGAMVGILLVYGVSRQFVAGGELYFLVASMGASAVLVFAVPHGALSQPWPVLGGNVISALVGVTVASLIAEPAFASMIAVGGAVLAMYYLRCLHPPGGATALLAVIGGPVIADLGFGYVFYPILLNAGLMVLAGIAFNALIPWRIYPHGLAPRAVPPAKQTRPGTISQEDIAFAMKSLGSFVDISAEDLGLIYQRAQEHALQCVQTSLQIRRNHYYSNGQLGANWQVRKVTWATGSAVVSTLVAGTGPRSSRCSFAEFQRWAQYEVVLHGEQWLRRAQVGAQVQQKIA